MAQTVRIMAWNIQNYGPSKHGKYGSGLIAFLALVVTNKTIDIAAFCELRVGYGKIIGELLIAKLGKDWEYFASRAFVAGRLEEYLFIWNAKKVKVTGGKKGFQHEFFGKDKKQIGFKRLTKDRPPVMAEFAGLDGTVPVRVAMIHSPNPGKQDNPAAAAANFVKITELHDGKTAAVIMGDMNIKAPAGATAPNSWGQFAFEDLVNANFKQMFAKDELTSLAGATKKVVKVADCLSQPYDQIFFRNLNKTTVSDAKVENLVAEALDSTGKNATEIGKALLPFAKARFNKTAIASYADAFTAYRYGVSDHFPVTVSFSS